MRDAEKMRFVEQLFIAHENKREINFNFFNLSNLLKFDEFILDSNAIFGFLRSTSRRDNFLPTRHHTTKTHTTHFDPSTQRLHHKRRTFER